MSKNEIPVMDAVSKNDDKSLMNFIGVGLANMDSGLGDRSKYVGSSDIGQCAKKSYLSKIFDVEYDLEQKIIFERGHIAESIVRNGLKYNPTAKVDFKEQVEVEGKGDLKFIKTHIDFLVNFPNELLVVECKTISSPLPNEQPRESWIYQVQLQLGLLRAKTKKEIRGKIAVFNLNTGKTYEFDVNYNQSLYHKAISRGLHIWNSLENRIEPDGEVSDLCAFCPFKDKCNTLRNNNELPIEIKIAVNRLKELKESIKEEKELKENIKAFLIASGIDKGVADEYTVSLTERRGRETVDIYKLKNMYPEIAKEVIKEGNSFTTLKVS